jgi:hypothetical protein
MRPQRFSSAILADALRMRVVATIEDLKRALGTSVDMTVFRKLREIPYVTSYSHRGRFYALQETARFDELGLWTHKGAHFSQFGSLVDTAERFVLRSERGYFAPELSDVLAVETKDTLLHLVESRRLSREVLAHLFLYCAPDKKTRQAQVAARGAADVDTPFGPASHRAVEVAEEVHAAIILFLGTLNEKQRRLYAGLESLRLGRGGDRRIAQRTGLDVHTVAKGREDLLRHDLDVEHVRRPGGGRKPLEKKRPK